MVSRMPTTTTTTRTRAWSIVSLVPSSNCRHTFSPFTAGTCPLHTLCSAAACCRGFEVACGAWLAGRPRARSRSAKCSVCVARTVYQGSGPSSACGSPSSACHLLHHLTSG
jgi:hypothetical protein